MLILNDIHLGVNRQGGTTPASREALRTYLFSSFRNAVENCTEPHLLILGDLFDQFEIDGRDWVEAYLILSNFLSAEKSRFLTLVAGNHDHSPKGQKVSSFEMLCRVLKEQSPFDVTVVGIDDMACVDDGKTHPEGASVYAVAHASNQDTFQANLTSLLTLVKSGDRVLLHANFNNGFAAESDHSLNLSAETAQLYIEKGVSLYTAHEHQSRSALSGYVTVFGNQWPSSVADCLNNNTKYMHVMDGKGVLPFATWDKFTGYAEIDWRELTLDPSTRMFIKITGTASMNEAGDCISAIAKFRSKSDAFVVSNGVKIDGIADNEALPESFEVTKAFDVLEFIYSNLDDAQTIAVKKLQGAS